MRIEIRIDDLVLHGFPPGDRYLIAEALQTDLARRIAGESLDWARAGDRAIPYLDVGSFQAAAGASPETVGAGIAATIQRGITTK